VNCWRVGDGDEMRNGVGWSELDPTIKPDVYRVSGSKLPALSNDKGRGTCGRCLGVLDFEPGSREGGVSVRITGCIDRRSMR
jgi:hypothetical protein